MTHLVLEHLGLAGVGIGALFALALALRLLARQDAVLRYRLMSAALCAALVLIPLQAVTAELAPHASVVSAAAAPSCPAPLVPTTIAATNPAAKANVPSQSECAPLTNADVSSTISLPVVPTPSGAPGKPVDPRLWPILLGVYVLGVCVIVVLLTVRALITRRLVQASRPVTDPRVLRMWATLVEGARRAPALLESDRLHVPACSSLGGDCVILPTGANLLQDETLLAAMRHELIHLRRHDGVLACVATGVSAVLWFQPLVWVFAHMLAADREHSCDALVVRATRQPRSYALALLQFCTLSRPVPRSISLIGFESSHSISQRITMLSHAMTPAARLRHAATAGVSLACFVSVAVGHGMLTAAADPGPVLAIQSDQAPESAAQVPAVQSQFSTTEDVKAEAVKAQAARSQPRMSAEVAARTYGRADGDVYRRLVKSGVIPVAPDAIRTDLFVFTDRPAARSAGVRLPVATVNEQETVLTAERATSQGNTIVAEQVRLSLPDGSKLRAVFEGRSVNIEPQVGAGTTIRITGGSVRIVDEQGVTRIEARASEQRAGATLSLSSGSTANALTFQIIAADGVRSIPVNTVVNPDSPGTKPEVVHGAVNWNLALPVNSQFGPGTGELKMQWTYDLDKLGENQGC
jgi:beta-lactamase regulating signal transducer with metallopeptidase domain